jgi:hypothetical protein
VAPQPHGSTLETEIRYSAIAEPVVDSNIGVVTGDCVVTFANALTAGDETIFDNVCAAHTGIGYVSRVMGSVEAVALEHAVTATVTPWETLNGRLTTPQFFTDEDPSLLPNLLGRVIGLHKGDGGEIQVLEEVDGEAVVLPNVGAVWTKFKFDTTVAPREGLRNIYKVQARLNGAASLDLEFVALSMLHVRQV